MRFDVHKVRCHLVEELLDTPQVKEVWHDGSDVIILDFKTGESVSIHMVERYMSIDEINYIFTENARNKLYTMLILWGDMFMPAHDQVYQPQDWMHALLTLYGNQIYAYDAWRDEPFMYSVNFHPMANTRNTFTVQHGEDIHISEISVDTVHTHMSGFNGFWRVARFNGGSSSEYTSNFFDDTHSPTAEQRQSVRYYFNLLGVSISAERDEVKQAYRDLARQHHPDRNDTDTTSRMQRINEAYDKIERYFDSEDLH